MSKILRATYNKSDGTQVEEKGRVTNRSLPGKVVTKLEDIIQALYPPKSTNKLEIDGKVTEEWEDKEPDRFKNIMNLLKGK